MSLLTKILSASPLSALRFADSEKSKDGLPKADGESSPKVKGLTLYHFNTCPYCIRVRATLAKLGVSVEMRNIHQSQQALDELVSGGGKKQVPCLRIESASDEDDGTGTETETETEVRWLYESGEIVRYLNQRFG